MSQLLGDFGSDDIVVAEGERIELSPNIGKYAKFDKIRPGSIEEAKALLGVPDPVERVSQPTISALNPNFLMSLNKPQMLRHLTDVGREFIYGNSKTVNAYKPILERQFLPQIQVAVARARDITIRSNGKLVIGRDTDILRARDINIEHSGSIVVNPTTFKISCRSIKGGVQSGDIVSFAGSRLGLELVRSGRIEMPGPAAKRAGGP